MLLILEHPEVAWRDCDHCQQFFYTPDGKVATWANGTQFRKRGPKELPPCRTASGCPKGTPEAPKSLNLVNLQAYIHYQECRAVGQFPDDAIVRQNARIIRAVEDGQERSLQRQTHLIIQQILARG